MKKPPKPKDTARRLKATIRQQPAVFAVYVVLRLIVVAELVLSILRGEYESAFICLLVLILFILPFSSSKTSVSNCRPPWKSSYFCSYLRQKYWASWRVISSPTPTGTPCSTPLQAFSAQPPALPSLIFSTEIAASSFSSPPYMWLWLLSAFP